MPESLRWLLHARISAFLREPEAVFWTFGFPVLIAIALIQWPERSRLEEELILEPME